MIIDVFEVLEIGLVVIDGKLIEEFVVKVMWWCFVIVKIVGVW